MNELHLFEKYTDSLADQLSAFDFSRALHLAKSLREAWAEDRNVFICGNGGSAANASHFASDLFYGTAKNGGRGIRAKSLSSNQSVLTCLANDCSYEEVFSRQLDVYGQAGDRVIVLSGSGNSPNVVRALERARAMEMRTFAIVGYGGGRCLHLAEYALHFPVEDMQIAEDLQLMMGHMVTQWLLDNPPPSLPDRATSASL